MQYAKKMALVDPRLVESLLPLIDQPPSTIRSRTMSSLDSDMKDVLDRSELSERAKVASYNRLLSRYNSIEAIRAAQPVRVSVVPTEGPPPQPTGGQAPLQGIEREIVESVPKTLRGKALLLIEKMKTDPLCRWNDRGEFVYAGRPIAGSNMVDLVNDLMRTRKKGVPPVGWEAFGDGMRRLNVPMELVGNARHRAYIQQQPKRSKKEEEAEETPGRGRYHRRRRTWDLPPKWEEETY